MNKNFRKIDSPQYNKALLNLVGENVFISANVEIRRPHLVSIGNNVAIDTGLYLTTRAEMGDYIHIGPYVVIIGGEKGCLKMGNFTNLAAGSKVICVSDEYLGKGIITSPGLPAKYRDQVKAKPVIFENFVNVGVNAVIFSGVTLAEGCVVGACSLVVKDTEPWTIYAGVPAKPIKKRPKEIMLRYAKELGY